MGWVVCPLDLSEFAAVGFRGDHPDSKPVSEKLSWYHQRRLFPRHSSALLIREQVPISSPKAAKSG